MSRKLLPCRIGDVLVVLNKWGHVSVVNRRARTSPRESRLYRNVATMGLASLESVLEGSNITIMGHKISFVLDPKEG